MMCINNSYIFSLFECTASWSLQIGGTYPTPQVVITHKLITQFLEYSQRLDKTLPKLERALWPWSLWSVWIRVTSMSVLLCLVSRFVSNSLITILFFLLNTARVTSCKSNVLILLLLKLRQYTNSHLIWEFRIYGLRKIAKTVSTFSIRRLAWIILRT